jgi:aldehyde:ferredoxin oxidoreductase
VGKLFGYTGKLLRVNLSQREINTAPQDKAMLQKYLGGMALGARLLYDEVPSEVSWSNPENAIILATGPLAGTKVMGSGTFCAVFKGTLTNGGTSTQANGRFGAFLKFAGFDGVVITGRAENLSYLYIHDGRAELKDAMHLSGKDTWETEDLIMKAEGLSFSSASVFGIGPAGENLAKFAALVGDRGHVAGHNGLGAVMGAKNLKAVIVARGKGKIDVFDKTELAKLTEEMFAAAKKDPLGSQVYKWGMLWTFIRNSHIGRLPVKNYTTNVIPATEQELATFKPEYLRAHYEITPNPCWACRMHHHHIMRIADGDYAGCVGKEPEYEGLAAMGSQIGVYDGLAATMLSTEADRLGLDVNEAGWVIGLAMECYEKGLLSKSDTGGLELTWGNAEAARALLKMIAHRQGIGDDLAEGGMRAARQIGGEATEFAIHTMGGNTPRTHDHRKGQGWVDMFDTCVSNTGVNEGYPQLRPERLGLTPMSGPYSHKDIANLVARSKGYFPLIDSLGICHFPNVAIPELFEKMVKAATGWDLGWPDLMKVGERAVNLLRAFNIRHGYNPALDFPSPRYGSILPDGVDQGVGIASVWDDMLDIYYREMGWDRPTGKPLPNKLMELELSELIRDLWPNPNEEGR